MSTQPTGRIETVDGVRRLVIEREFRAPIDDVWAAVTEPERLARWIGVWTGDPASGHVQFAMTAESEDATADDMEIRECDPPRRLAVTSQVGDERWQLELELVERDGVTVLTFTHPDIDPAVAESVGPGWEYYLDRLGAVLTGADVVAIDFDRDYYPAMAEHYRGQIEHYRGQS
jgi:uncharacterized protein YndB with AHSA1/START domain